MNTEHVVVFVTAPKGKGEEIAKAIVEKRLAACVNIVDNIKSIYWWQDKVEEDFEELLIIKTKYKILEKLIEEVKRAHPYTVPEIISLPIILGNKEYLEWINKEVKD